MTLEYTVDGRRVTAEQFSRLMYEKARDAAIAGARQRIGSVRCPVHGSRPTIREKRVSGDRFEFDISGCCDALISKARHAL
jgi:hypothetical protein